MIELYLAVMLFGIGSYYNKLNTKNNVLSNKNSSLSNKNNVLSNKNNILKVHNSHLNNKNSSLSNRNNHLSNKNSHLSNENNYLNKKNDSLKQKKMPIDFSEISNMTENNAEIKKYIPQKTNKIKSSLTDEEISIDNFVSSSTISKDESLENINTSWAVPYISKTTQPKIEGFQNKLEIFTGSNKYNFHKKENKTFFKPTKSLSYTNGAPNNLSFLEKRYNNSNNRTNELPFEQEQVAPGVGQNYKNKGKGAFHQYEINEIVKPKSIDELRSLSNPKITYKQPIISGKKIDSRSSVPNVRKNRPEKVHLNSPSRYLKTTGAYLKGKSDEKFILKTTSRAVSKELFGSAGPISSSIKPTALSKYKKSTKNLYGNSGLRNVYQKHNWSASAKNSDYGKSNYRLPPNERDVTQKRTHINNITSLVKAIIQPLQDKMKRTKKQNIEGNPNKEGYFSVNVPNKLTVYDPNDIAKTTIRETTENNERDGNIAGPNKLTVYDPNDIARTTIKETTIHNKGHSVIKGSIKLTVYDPNDIPRTTIKETTIHNERKGNINLEHIKKHRDYNVLPPKRTIKETTIDNNHITNVSYTRGDGLGYLSTDYFAPSTMKQFTSNKSYRGNVSANQHNKGGYLSNRYEAPATMKQFTSNKSYTGASNSNNKLPSSYKSSYNARTNSNREKISKGRTPTQTGVKLMSSKETVNTIYKKQNSTINYKNNYNVSVGPQKIQGYSSQTSTTRRVPLSNRNELERTNKNVLKPLRNNPYHISITKEIEDYISEVSGDEQENFTDSENNGENSESDDTDADIDNFISEISDNE